MCACVGTHVPQGLYQFHEGYTIFRSQISPFTMYIPWVKLGSLGLASGLLACIDILPALETHIFWHRTVLMTLKSIMNLTNQNNDFKLSNTMRKKKNSLLWVLSQP